MRQIGDTQNATSVSTIGDAPTREFTPDEVLEAVWSLGTKASLSPAYVLALQLNDPAAQTMALSKLVFLPHVCQRSLRELIHAHKTVRSAEGEFYAAWCIGLGLKDIGVTSRLIQTSQSLRDSSNIYACASLAHNVPEVRELAPVFLAEVKRQREEQKEQSIPADPLLFMAPCDDYLLQNVIGLASNQFLSALLHFYWRFRLPVPPSARQRFSSHDGYSEIWPFSKKHLANWDGEWSIFENALQDEELEREAHDVMACCTTQQSVDSIAGVLERWQSARQLPDACLNALESLAICEWNVELPQEKVSHVLNYASILGRYADKVSMAIPLLHEWKRKAYAAEIRLYARAALDLVAPETLTSEERLLDYRLDLRTQVVDERGKSGILRQLTQSVTPEEPSDDVVAAAIRLSAQAEDALGHVVSDLQDWLSSLKGEVFASENARERIDAIRNAVASAGCELFFEDRPVTLVALTSGRKSAALHLKTLRSSPVETIYSSQSFPELEARPLTQEKSV